MTATNHVLTGSLIAVAISNPILALPIAFLSHFFCDALPHFGRHPKFKQSSRAFAVLLLSDCLLAAIVLLFTILIRPDGWAIMAICGVLAASADLMWLPNYVRTLKGVPVRPRNAIMRFHGWVQWGERPWGFILEFIWFTLSLGLLIYYTKPLA